MLGSKQGGLGRYVEQLIFHLSLIDHDNEYVLFLRRENWDAVKVGDEKFKFTKVLADISWYGWQEQFLFSRLIRKAGVDVMHFPHWNVPLLFCGRFVVTIHDLLLLHYPTRAASRLGPIGYWFKNAAYRCVLKHAVKSARHILTTSEFTKQDIHKTLGVSLDKMTVTYQAPGQPQSLLSRNGTKHYVLYVGVAYPHKNLDRLVEAWKIVQVKTNDKYQLILVGTKNYFYDRLEKKIDDEKIANVMLTGFVTDEDLSGLYRDARLYVFPSLYEGFGLPPLEAWTHNVPVAASNRTCMPEILGEGALYFDPESVEQMADAIIQGLTNEDVRSTLRENARIELQRYSGLDLAKQTLSVYLNQ